MHKRNGMDRRVFLRTSAVGAAGAATLLSVGPAEAAARGGQGEIPKIKAYRTLGRTGFKVSDIGIGTARVYPVPVMNAVLDAGVNYIDTAEGYGRGAAERNIGEAIQGRDRESLFITTKIRMRGVTSTEQVVEKAEACLERLKTEYIDCLMVQGPATAADVADENFHAGMEQLKKDGKIRFVGVASHGSRFQGQGDSMEKVLTAAVEDGRFDLLLVVYNFIQKDDGERVMAAAAKKNIAVTIMKSDPLGRYFEMRERVARMKKEGEAVDERTQGYLDRMEETAEQAKAFIERKNLKSPGEIKLAALKFVLANPAVHTLNLAFNNFDDVANYLSLSGTGPDSKEKAALAAYEESCGRLYCRHACGLCEPECPHGVPINTIMRYNHYFEAHGSEKFAMEKYAGLETSVADLCRNCAGWCEKACPHGVPIQGLLNLAHARLSL